MVVDDANTVVMDKMSDVLLLLVVVVVIILVL